MKKQYQAYCLSRPNSQLFDFLPCIVNSIMDPLGRFQSLIELLISVTGVDYIVRLINHYKYTDNLSDNLLKKNENGDPKRIKSQNFFILSFDIGTMIYGAICMT
jgi:hypothetical protein